MNLEDAIQAHAGWKMKLAAYLRHPDKSINASDAGRDDKCPLGQWLHGEAKKTLAGLPEYKSLVTEHAHFHKTVAKVVDVANSGKKLDEDAMLHGESEFATTSRNVVTLIAKLKKKMAAA